MKKSRFMDEQIIGMIKEQESGMPTKKVCRKCPASWKLDYLKLEFSNYDPFVRRKERSMGKSKFTDAQIAFILKQVDQGTAVAELYRKTGTNFSP